jgi:hypothetical protein
MSDPKPRAYARAMRAPNATRVRVGGAPHRIYSNFRRSSQGVSIVCIYKVPKVIKLIKCASRVRAGVGRYWRLITGGIIAHVLNER